TGTFIVLAACIVVVSPMPRRRPVARSTSATDTSAGASRAMRARSAASSRSNASSRLAARACARPAPAGEGGGCTCPAAPAQDQATAMAATRTVFLITLLHSRCLSDGPRPRSTAGPKRPRPAAACFLHPGRESGIAQGRGGNGAWAAGLAVPLRARVLPGLPGADGARGAHGHARPHGALRPLQRRPAGLLRVLGACGRAPAPPG